MASNNRVSSTLGRIRIIAPPLFVAVGLPLSYFAAASLSFWAFGTNTPVWVSNAFAVAALLRNKPAVWPFLLVLTAIADYGANALFGAGPILTLGIVPCDVSEILLVSVAISKGGDASLRFSTIWQTTKFALICGLVTIVSSAGGAGLLTLTLGEPFLALWSTWYLADTFGLLIVIPLLMSWTDQSLRSEILGIVIVKAALLSGLVAVVGYLDFNGALPGLFLTFPFLILASFHGRLLGATTATAALTIVATWSTFHGHGPIAQLPNADLNVIAQVQSLQFYLLVVLFSTLPVAAILEQREGLTVQLRESTRKAEAAVRAKSEFLAVMSHEIRTPMTGVLGMTDLLIDAHLPTRERDYVLGIRASGRYLLTLINDILDFSRIEAGKLELEITDFSIPAMLEQVRSLMTPQASERGLELYFEFDEHSPQVVRGDPTRLKQVLINLVGNGIKFTQRGGVTVAVSRRPADGGRERFRFEVRDTGIGIPEDKRSLLFNAFSQVDSSTTRQFGGSGLGLAISKRLVEAMGGEIAVESVVGVGSRFWFETPLELGDILAVEAAMRHPLIAVPPQRVLLVEDVELNQVLIADMLRSHGHEVAVAVNGEEAVRLVRLEHFDLVLMDVQMPVMDGVEATRRIRALPPPAGQVPVLALTASVMAHEREGYLAAGMNGALAKPIDWSRLFEAMAHYGGQGPDVVGPVTAPGPETAAGPVADLPVDGPDAIARAAVTPLNIDMPLDSRVLDKLHRLQGGTEDFTVKLTELFARDTGRRLVELRSAVSRADAPAVAQLAHAIRGSAASLGARIVVRICTGIEARAEASDLESAPAWLDELEREFTRACDALGARPKVA
jgi:signal transduction histidine kinase/HPt (histidine-containing phosphotransfer) domain-containing protein/ActR/RegA family two-component response regulator